MNKEQDVLARALGLASLGLGVPMVSRPDIVNRTAGVHTGRTQRIVTTVVGAREMAAAAALLVRPHPAWLWGRVAGDVMDLGMLGGAMRKGSRRTMAATALVAGITALDTYAAITRTRRSGDVEVRGVVTVGRPAREVYDYWHRLENLSTFMAHVEEVRVTGPSSSHWRVTGPFSQRAGGSVEWDAETTEDIPGEVIAWRSTADAAVHNEGEVRFRPAPGDRGTEVHVRISYSMPLGKLGWLVARTAGEAPEQQLDDDLRRFKQVMETGEVVRSDGAPGGKRARREFPQHAARPLAQDEIAQEVRA